MRCRDADLQAGKPTAGWRTITTAEASPRPVGNDGCRARASAAGPSVPVLKPLIRRFASCSRVVEAPVGVKRPGSRAMPCRMASLPRLPVEFGRAKRQGVLQRTCNLVGTASAGHSRLTQAGFMTGPAGGLQFSRGA